MLTSFEEFAEFARFRTQIRTRTDIIKNSFAKSMRLTLELERYQQSKLFGRIESTQLRTMVETVAKHAAPLLNDIGRYMPLFTLHDERHILNVIAWMDWLLEPVLAADPKSGGELDETECALLLLAAYVHDLGMSLSAEDHARIQKEGTDEHHHFQAFLDGFPEDRKQIAQLRAQSEHPSANLIENSLLTEYLRRTHSDRHAARMKNQVDRIVALSNNAGLFTDVHNIDLRTHLERLAISHNQSVAWLRDGSTSCPYNLSFLGLVLRLADILDFDSSRTPRILFSHLGFEGKLGRLTALLDPSGISNREWRKHLAIQFIEFDETANKLEYQAYDCPDPATDHAIRGFVTDINNEIAGARDEITRVGLHHDDPRRQLRLPAVGHKITPLKGAYVYQDWQFQSDHEEIINLLMGESLYGEPELAIRELLQNALDALELRDLRLRYRKATGGQDSAVDAKTDGAYTGKPGWFVDSAGADVELHVLMTWGHDTIRDRYWIQIEDNGVGMSRPTIERYFTRLGKSFYRSEDFKREAETLRKQGLICTPISQFGIGVLSSFMLADRIEIRTHCGGADAERATDFHVSGPGTLFWSNEGSRKRQGTEVKLWMRSKFKVRHEWEECLSRLRQKFEYPGAPKGELKEPDFLDPVFAAAQSVLWPRYPIVLDHSEHRIDADLHPRILGEIDETKVRAKAAEWDVQLPPGKLRWAFTDWVDDHDLVSATGSRIRVWFPSFDEQAKLPAAACPAVPFWMLSGFVEPHLDSGRGRTRTLVRGMQVIQDYECMKRMEWFHAVGTYLWLDLRGNATPRLTANRKQALVPSDTWAAAVQNLFERWSVFAEGSARAWLGWPMCRDTRIRLGQATSASQSPSRDCRAEVGDEAQQYQIVASQLFLQDCVIACDLAHDLVRDHTLPGPIDKALDGPIERAFDLIRGRARLAWEPGREADRARDLERYSPVSRNLAVSRGLGLRVGLGRNLDLDFAPVGKWWLLSSEGAIPSSHFLQEAFFPSLRESWPPLGLCSFDGAIIDAELLGPGLFQIHRHPITGLVYPSPPHLPVTQLQHRGYDFCFPMTTFCVGEPTLLSSWKAERAARQVCLLPFLFPSPPSTWSDEYMKRFQQLAGVSEIFALIPPYELWFKPFLDWTEADWKHPDHMSLLYDNRTGETLICRGAGVVDRAEMRNSGEPYHASVTRYVKRHNRKAKK